MSYNQDIILEAIRSHPGATTEELSNYTKIHRETINRPLRALVRDGLARAEVVAYHGVKKYWVVP